MTTNPRHCNNCMIQLHSRRKVYMNQNFCHTCYQTAPSITGPCYGCRNTYTSDIRSRNNHGHYCQKCIEKRRIQHQEHRIRMAEELRIQTDAAIERQRLLRLRLEEQERERQRQAAEHQRLEAERAERERRDEEMRYNAGIDNMTALDHRALCKIIYDMHLQINQLNNRTVTMRDTIDSMQETIDSYQTAFKKVRRTANMCFSALDDHKLLKTTTPDTSDESEYEQ